MNPAHSIAANRLDQRDELRSVVHAGYAARTLGIDLRSLAAFRIAAGLLLLVDLFFRAGYLGAFYTDLGVLPRVARIELYERVDASGMRHTWSLNMASGEWWAQAVLMSATAACALALLVGYRTRLATLGSWILLSSLDSRNPMIMDSGDTLLRCLLFWLMFAPSGAVASVDSYLRPPPLPSDRKLFTAATAALLLQLYMMYWFAVIHKTHPYWLKEYSAVYYALSNDIFVTRLGRALLAYPRFLQTLTFLTYWLELLGPLLLFSPRGTAWLRCLVAMTFAAMHAAFGMTLSIGLFAPICVSAWILVLPGEFWDGLSRWADQAKWRESFVRMWDRRAERIEAFFSQPEQPCLKSGWISRSIVLGLLVYVTLWNIRELDVDLLGPKILPRQMNVIGRATGLEQRWSMFAPVPSTDDGWYVMRGRLRDGSEVNLWQPTKELPWKKPPYVAATYVSQRWRKYLDNLKHDGNAPHRQYFADWLQRRWNLYYAQNNPQRQVVEVELVFQFEETARPGGETGEPLTTRLWTWQYE